MREILFRGKRKDNGQWLESGSFCRCGDDGIIWEYFLGTGKPAVHDVDAHGNIRASVTLETCMFCVVDPKTVCQFTGLTDKNGKKVFEGDIIRFHKFRYEPDWTGVVIYDICRFAAKGRMPLAYEKPIDGSPYYCPFEVDVSGIDKATIEVIGNIHDNPELLGGED